jgi:hypothetical protein
MIIIIEKIVPNFKAKRFTKKSYLKSTKIGSCCGKFFIAANFDSLSTIEFFHEILGTKPLYVHNIW